MIERTLFTPKLEASRGQTARFGKWTGSPLVFLILPVTIAFAIFPGIFVLHVRF
ncbi:MAG: hypothetical protein JWP85_1108 [Rhodoglobus sp.]|nr:hypothetical protein [Rhodoglobus sp.]